MQYAPGARDTPKQACLPGTRTAMIQNILDWVNLPNTEDVSRVFWLRGVAGSGKSALALTVRDHFDSVNLLGSAFFFDKAVADRVPSKLFSTISRDIADLIPEWRLYLTDVLKHSQAVRTSAAVEEQWSKFVLGPAQKLAQSRTAARRIVIIIDALDEAGNLPTRKIMLSVFKQLCKLPPLFRVFITSRPEEDIHMAFDTQALVAYKNMAEIDEGSTMSDLESYIHSHLSSVNSLTTASLAKKSAGNFEWVATACRFIQGESTVEYEWAGINFQDRLNLVLRKGETHGLDGLYTSILNSRFSSHVQNLDFRSRFHAVLGQVLYTQQPLTLNALAELREDQKGKEDTKGFLCLLGSLLQGVSGKETLPVRLLHTSFRTTSQHLSGVVSSLCQ